MVTQLLVRSLSVATAGALAVGLAACSSSGAGSATVPTTSAASTSSTAASTPTTGTSATSTTAAAGSVTSGDGSFSVVPPAGWKDAAQKPAILVIKAPTVQDGVTTNFNVIVQDPQPTPSLDEILTQSKAAWRQQGAQITDKPDRTIAGSPSRGYTLQRTVSGTKLAQTQYFIVHQEHIYTLTLTNSTSSTASSDADKALDSILASWTWSQS